MNTATLRDIRCHPDYSIVTLEHTSEYSHHFPGTEVNVRTSPSTPNARHLLLRRSHALSACDPLPAPSPCGASNLRSCPCERIRMSVISRSTGQCLHSAHQRSGTHRFLIASALPTRRALLTASARLTLPIWRRFILDGLGSFTIQSGTVEPDCRMTFAMLQRGQSAVVSPPSTQHARLEERGVLIGKVCHGLAFSARATRTTYGRPSATPQRAVSCH